MNTQKIAVFGSPGETTHRLVTEALRRGHSVTAVVPNQKQFEMKHPSLKVVNGDARKKEDVTKYAKGHDVVICAYEPTKAKAREHVEVTRSVIEGIRNTGVNRILCAAHPFGQPSETTEEAYNEFKPILKAQQEALKLFKNEKDLQWGYAHSIEPEAVGSTGKYLASSEVLFSTSEGENKIPLKGYTSAIIDEAEKGEMELHGEENEEEREY